MNLKDIFNQVWAYHDFHSEINKYFNEGINFSPHKKEEIVYKINANWIENWKNYSSYDLLLTYGKNFKELKKLNIKVDKANNLQNFSKQSSTNFFDKILYSIKDFDCLIDETTYLLFKKYQKKNFFSFLNFELNPKKLKEMRCIFHEKMFILISKADCRVKLFSRYIQKPHNELIQLTLVFPKFFINENIDIVEEIFTIRKEKNNIDYIHIFKEKYLKDENRINSLIEMLTNELKMDISLIKEYNFKISKKKQFTIMITNNNLFQKQNIIENINLNQYLTSLNLSNTPRLIGLENIGATCYMNATLQCMVNIKEFTNYLLNKNNLTHILDNINNCELLGSYCKLLEKLCCDKSVINYYAPKNFKNILSLKNALFQGIQANDSKDLIYFLLEHFNEELNIINLKINPVLQKDENLIDDMSQMNKYLVFSNFINEYSSQNNNIIPKLFFSLTENESFCIGCQSRKYK